MIREGEEDDDDDNDEQVVTFLARKRESRVVYRKITTTTATHLGFVGKDGQLRIRGWMQSRGTLCVCVLSLFFFFNIV